jgi:hypothetical protein
VTSAITTMTASRTQLAQTAIDLFMMALIAGVSIR